MQRDARELGGAWREFQVHAYDAPPADLAPYIARYWRVDWDLRGQPPYRQLIVPYPTVHLSFVNDDPPQVHGVSPRPVVRVLEGRGLVFGVAFRSFRPFLGRPVATLTGRSVPAATVLGPLPGTVAELEEVLRNRLRPDKRADEVAAIVDRIAADPAMRRVDDVAAGSGIGVRRLQRLFVEYVGVGPKWVIRRYRLHEITQRLEEDAAGVDWAGLAADLGYADQAHLVRDFTSMVGEPPTHYARRYRSRQS